MDKKIIGIVVIVIVIAFFIFRGLDKNKINLQPTTSTPTISQESKVSPTIQLEGEVKTINIEAGAFYYNPKEIRVKKGEKVKVVVTSKDMMHNFNIDELNVKSALAKAGEITSVEFTADKTGTFEYYCSVGKHRANGQVGQLIVE